MMLLSILPLLVVNVYAEAEAEFRGKGLAKDFGSTVSFHLIKVF